MYIYTDGTLQNGVGGFGIYLECTFIENYVDYKYMEIDEISKFIGICNDINYIELKAIMDAIQYILHNNIYNKLRYKKIYIITDSEQSYQWLAGLTMINQSYIHELIIKSYKNIKQLYIDYGYTIILQWCKGHIWRGNIRADHLADYSIKQQQTPYYDINHINSTNPLSIRSVKNVFKSSIFNSYKKSQFNNLHVLSYRLSKWNMFQIYTNKYILTDIQIDQSKIKLLPNAKYIN